jgi:hypothetical protein
MTKEINFSKNSEYKIGPTTFKVSSFFNEEGKSIKEKINNLILCDIKNTISKVACQQNNVVK